MPYMVTFAINIPCDNPRGSKFHGDLRQNLSIYFIEGFHSHGDPQNGWFMTGKSHLEMDEDWG